LTAEDIDQLPSCPFKGFDWSEHAAASRLIDELSGEYEAWYKGDAPGKRLRDIDKIKQHLTHFVLEAYRTHRALPEMAMSVHLGDGYYNQHGDRYHPNHLAYRIVVHVTDFLVAAGYLKMPSGKGEWHPDKTQRRTTRYRATQKLIDLCDEYGISPYMIVPYEDPEVIILRAKKKRGQTTGDLVDYTDTAFTRRARKDLRKINIFIAGHHINLDITDEQEADLRLRMRKQEDPAKDKYLDFTKTRLRRIFNNSSFEQGGRFYGAWWISVTGDYRSRITINKKRTVSLDYSGMHFAIMYAGIGMDMPMADPYALSGYDAGLRNHIKKAFNIIVNCVNRKQAVGAVDGRIETGELSAELGDGDRLIDAFAETHPLIKDKIASGEGVWGQFTDSRIAERILLKGIALGLCILPIHDGFITTAGDQFILEKLMDAAFSEVTGHNAKIKPETFDLSVLDNAGIDEPHWVTRSDGNVERDGPLEGKATSFSRVVSGEDLWGKVVEAVEKKRNKNMRDKEWKLVHGQ
jgi:hypothetical protein